MALTLDEQPKVTLKERATKVNESLKGSQAWNSIFRPGSIFRRVTQIHHVTARM